MALSIMLPNIKKLLMLSVSILVSVARLSIDTEHYNFAECCYTEVIVLSDVMLSLYMACLFG